MHNLTGHGTFSNTILAQEEVNIPEEGGGCVCLICWMFAFANLYTTFHNIIIIVCKVYVKWNLFKWSYPTSDGPGGHLPPWRYRPPWITITANSPEGFLYHPFFKIKGEPKNDMSHFADWVAWDLHNDIRRQNETRQKLIGQHIQKCAIQQCIHTIRNFLTCPLNTLQFYILYLNISNITCYRCFRIASNLSLDGVHSQLKGCCSHFNCLEALIHLFMVNCHQIVFQFWHKQIE